MNAFVFGCSHFQKIPEPLETMPGQNLARTCRKTSDN
jgi:hypothetical protein